MATRENVLPYDRPKLSKVGAIVCVDAAFVMATETYHGILIWIAYTQF